MDFFLFFITFLILGLWLASTNPNRKQIVFTKSPQQAFFIMLVGIALIAASAIGLYYSGKKYTAAVYYSQGLKSAGKEDFDINTTINLFNKAADLDSASDLYLRELSEAYLIKLGQIQSNQSLSQEQKQQDTQSAFSQLAAVVARMLELNPANSQNYEQAGKVYANLIALDFNAYQLAMDNYNKAKELNPNNPSILLNLASLNFELLKSVHNQLSQKDLKEADKSQLQDIYEQNLETTLANADLAIKLKNNYSPAYYFKAAVYEFSGQNDLALANYQIVLQLEPNNQAVIDKIKTIPNLNKK